MVILRQKTVSWWWWLIKFILVSRPSLWRAIHMEIIHALMLQTRALHLVFHRKVSPILLIALTPSLWISIFPFSPRIPVCPLLFWGFPASRASSFFSNLFSPLIPSFLSHKCGNVIKSIRLSQFCVRTHSLGHLLFWNDVGIGLIGSVRCAVERVSLPVCEWGSCTIVFQFLLFLIVWTCGISCSWCFPSSKLPLSHWRYVCLWPCSVPISVCIR